MKKIILFISLLFLLPQNSFGELRGSEIVKRVDDKMDRSSSLSQVEMKVFRRDKLRKTYGMKMKSRGTDNVLIEFLYPPRNKGEKYLKVDKNMWIYRPKIKKTIRISGRSNFSGSDFSNTDILSVRLDKDYNATLLGIEKFKGEDAYKLELLAKSEEVSYAKIIYFVRKKDLVPLRREFYTISGHLLKILEFKRKSNLFSGGLPDTFIMSNVLEKSKLSVMTFKTYKGNQKFSGSVFRKSSLRKTR